MARSGLLQSKQFSPMLTYSTVIIVLCCLTWSPALAQQQPPQPPTDGGQNNLCGSRFEAALAPECFDKANINFTGVIYILSGNRTGAIPEGYTFDSFLEYMCSVQMQDQLIPCVLRQMQRYNSTQCTEEDRLGVLGRGGQLLAFMDAVCGAPCEQEATQSLIQCYAAINVNPEPILNPNASIADDKFSILGANESEFDNFCTNRQKLFSCLSPLSSTCPGFLERLYTIGIDLQAMEAASDLMCNSKQQYFQGLECFTKPTPSITQCRQQTESNMRQVLVGRYQTGDVIPSDYMAKLCQSKLTQVDCELSSFAQTCDAEIAELRNTVECSMLPTPCRDNEKFGPVYNKICQTVTTPVPSTVRPTKPSGRPGQVPGTQTDDNDGDDDDDDDSGGSIMSVGLSTTLTICICVLLTWMS